MDPGRDGDVVSPRVRVTEEQLLQALRELGATSSDTAVTTRKVAQHLGEPTSYIRDRLSQMRVVHGQRRRGHPSRFPAGDRNYWWAIEDAS